MFSIDKELYYEIYCWTLLTLTVWIYFVLEHFRFGVVLNYVSLSYVTKVLTPKALPF